MCAPGLGNETFIWVRVILMACDTDTTRLCGNELLASAGVWAQFSFHTEESSPSYFLPWKFVAGGAYTGGMAPNTTTRPEYPVQLR